MRGMDEETRIPFPLAKPFPMGRAAKRECGFSRIVKANTRIFRKKNNDEQSLPRVGKVASGASRIGFWRYEKERGRSSQVRRLQEHPIHRCAVPLPQTITPCGATVNENGFLLSLGWRRRHSSFPIGRLSPLSKLFWSPLLNHILSRAHAP